MWRSLPKNEKQTSIQLSINVASEQRHVRKRCQKPKSIDIFHQDSTTKDLPPSSNRLPEAHQGHLLTAGMVSHDENSVNKRSLV
jgi:hypothetical protein